MKMFEHICHLYPSAPSNKSAVNGNKLRISIDSSRSAAKPPPPLRCCQFLLFAAVRYFSPSVCSHLLARAVLYLGWDVGVSDRFGFSWVFAVKLIFCVWISPTQVGRPMARRKLNQLLQTQNSRHPFEQRIFHCVFARWMWILGYQPRSVQTQTVWSFGATCGQNAFASSSKVGEWACGAFGATSFEGTVYICMQNLLPKGVLYNKK